MIRFVSSLDQVGGVHFSLLSKVQYDIGDSRSLDSLIDSIFPLFRRHIEPDLHHAQVGLSCLPFLSLLSLLIFWTSMQIRINNSFVSSFREAIYKIKCRSDVRIVQFSNLNLGEIITFTRIRL